MMKITSNAHMNYMLFAAIAVGIMTLLNACATLPIDPYQIDGFMYQETDQMSYLWTTGAVFGSDFADFAIILKIDDVNIPQEYLPPVKLAPRESHLIAIPAGEHTVTIIYKEIYMDAKVLMIAAIAGPGTPQYTKIRAQENITLLSEPNRTYAPWVDDKCSQVWFWI